jgi:flavorubredoxin
MSELHAPAHHYGPLQIADDTFRIRQLQGEGEGPIAVYVNSMVIRGAEPVVVDTGAPTNREQWLADVFSIVEPEDVRWIFLSHDDVDHYGNLPQILDACPNATFVTNWFIGERMGCAFEAPIERMRWVEHGQAFDAGDRRLIAHRPPAFDSPTTRGLLDTSTGVYWAVDSFASPVLAAVVDVADLDPGFWAGIVPSASRMMTPWIDLVDERKWVEAVDATERLGVRTIASCHSPVITGSRVATAFDLLRSAPSAPALPMPGQADLEAMIAATAGPATTPLITTAA